MEQVALEDTFGESGNGALLLEKYGLTAEPVSYTHLYPASKGIFQALKRFDETH